MTIEEAIKEIESITVVTDEKQALAFALAVHTMKKYQMIQVGYENRLKADMVAVLEELRLSIEELDYPKDCDYACNGCLYWGDVDNVIQQKINELPQESTTKNDLGVDCVARHDVERFIEGFINEYTPEEELEFINLELDGLKHLPPATPQEQKIGHWTTVLHEEILFCSECHQRLVDEQTYIPLHYCPNCGARMVESQESEDKE